MPSITPKRFNWLTTRSTWQQMEAWRERQKAHRENFEASAAQASSAFESARTGLSSGMAEIAAQMAADRVSANLQAKIASVNKLA